MKLNEQIESMLNKPYVAEFLSEKEICWSFCRMIFKLYGIDLPEFPHQGIKRIEQEGNTIPCVILFRFGSNWHSGVVWPDGLHFIHANLEKPLKNEPNQRLRYIIRKERLTRWPWDILTEGIYNYV